MKPIEAKSALPIERSQQPLNKAVNDDRKKVHEAAEQFESMLVLQMLRTMQSSLESKSLFGENSAAQTYGSLGEWELARTVAKSGDFGLTEYMMKELDKLESRNGIQSK